MTGSVGGSSALAYWRGVIDILEERFPQIVFWDERRRECPQGSVLAVLADWSWNDQCFLENTGLSELAGLLKTGPRPALILGWQDEKEMLQAGHGELLNQTAVRYASLFNPLEDIGKALEALTRIADGAVEEAGAASRRQTIIMEIDGIVHHLASTRSFIERTGRDGYCGTVRGITELHSWLGNVAKLMAEDIVRLDFAKDEHRLPEVGLWVGVYSTLVREVKRLVPGKVDFGRLECQETRDSLRKLLVLLEEVMRMGYAIVKLRPRSNARAGQMPMDNSSEIPGGSDRRVSKKPRKGDKTVLVVDDQVERWLDAFNDHLQARGYHFVGEEEADRTLDSILQTHPDVVLLDILFPDGSGRVVNRGRELLADIKKRYPNLPVVMFTSTLADESIATDQQDYESAAFLFAKETLRTAAAGFEPFAELAFQLDRAIERAALTQPLDERLGFVVGDTSRMLDVAKAILNVAGTSSTVLITGETGTGKELVARAIHRLSPRKDGAFIAVNCGGLTDETLESRLFGHKKGAFTGADRDTPGFFGEAEGGTLFLDEIEAMSTRFQELLLRVLQEKKITKMGMGREVAVDVRIIAATNQDLRQRVAEGGVRQDLYQRLASYEIDLPPLRERMADLPMLFIYLVHKKNLELGLRVLPLLREDVAATLSAREWAGNIRELENAIHAAMIDAKANVLTPSAFSQPALRSEKVNVEVLGLAEEILNGRAGWTALRDIKGEMRRAVLETLIRVISHRDRRRPSSARLAKLLGMSADNLRRVLSDAGIALRDF